MRPRAAPRFLLLLVVLAASWSFGDAEPMDWQILHDGDPVGEFSSVAYDASRDRIVMFMTLHPDQLVWEFDGTYWKQVFLSNLPTPAHEGPALAYDSSRQVVVLFGGDSNESVLNPYLNDTWEYDGVTWTQKVTAHRPQKRAYAAMAFDSDRGKMVLFGGVG